MLWKLSISNSEENSRIIPVFINKDFVVRPLSGKRIMDMFLNDYSRLMIKESGTVDSDCFEELKQISINALYDDFESMKADYVQKNEDQYRKYKYAWELRNESVSHIGIENIRHTRKRKLQEEKNRIEAEYKQGKQVCPELSLMLLVRLEA